MKKIAILQSNYIPWKGYFDIMGSVDEFVIYDEMQYTKNDWRNRNKIKTTNGLIWLTIPVKIEKLNQKINETKIAGVIATNTTISREGLQSENKSEMGGLSGKPLTKRSTEVIRFLSEKSNKSFPIIGVGGIHTAEDAIEKLNAGASLVQLYTGFIYEGPALVKAINKKILENS